MMNVKYLKNFDKACYSFTLHSVESNWYIIMNKREYVIHENNNKNKILSY